MNLVTNYSMPRGLLTDQGKFEEVFICLCKFLDVGKSFPFYFYPSYLTFYYQSELPLFTVFEDLLIP
jgi:hypothetical protein